MSAPAIYRASLASTRADPVRDQEAFVWHEDGGLLVRDGRIAVSGAFDEVRRGSPDTPVVDWRGGLVVPGFVDTHIHYPQLRVIGSLGLSLLDWLERAALPEEVRMADVAYATETARRFVGALAAHGTTTALVFGAHFPAATASLFEAAAAAGLRVTSGLVVSDRMLRPELHRSPEDAYRESTALIQRFHGRGRLRYAITPRFALSTSEAMLEICQTLAREHDTVAIQSHINENRDEVAAVAGAFGWASDYLAVYERYALTGPRAVLAHNVLGTDGELERLAATGTSIAHCPGSNAALGSGIFPLRRHREYGVHVALGTDVGGGVGFGLMKEALHAHLLQRVAADGVVLDARQLLYLSTLAGARALRLEDEVGSLCAGKAADFVYLRPPDGSVLESVLQRASGPEQLLNGFFALAGAECVREVHVDGARIHPS
jgi:guanine deaminase